METKKNDTAFPIYRENGYVESGRLGLTKREYFAAMAMQGIFASKNTEPDASMLDIVGDSVRIADLLIEKLNK